MKLRGKTEAMIDVFDFAAAPTSFCPRPTPNYIGPPTGPRPRRLLRAIARLEEDWGYAPAVRGLVEETEIPSTGVVAFHLATLWRLGYVTWSEGKSRTHRLTGLEPPVLSS